MPYVAHPCLLWRRRLGISGLRVTYCMSNTAAREGHCNCMLLPPACTWHSTVHLLVHKAGHGLCRLHQCLVCTALCCCTTLCCSFKPLSMPKQLGGAQHHFQCSGNIGGTHQHFQCLTQFYDSVRVDAIAYSLQLLHVYST